MSWLDALLRPKPALDPALAGALAAHRALPRPDPGAPLASLRAIVVDVEASGLDPALDRLISIGAVAVSNGLVRLDDSFEVILRQDQPSAAQNIIVHRIGEAAQSAGREPAAGLIDFLRFCGKNPIVAFHAGFDRRLIERAMRATLGYTPDNAWLDLAMLAPALFPGRAAGPALDDWLAAFGIENAERHNALADAIATAHLLLAVSAQAQNQGVSSASRLRRLEREWRWLRGRFA